MKRQYIIVHFKGGYTSGPAMLAKASPTLFDGEWEKRLFPESNGKDVFAYRVDGVTQARQSSAMFYNEELAGPDGMRYLLFKEPNQTPADLSNAKAFLRATQDVVTMRTVTITEWTLSPDIP